MKSKNLPSPHGYHSLILPFLEYSGIQRVKNLQNNARQKHFKIYLHIPKNSQSLSKMAAVLQEQR